MSFLDLLCPIRRVSCIESTVSDLEGMIQGQKQLMEKLTDECKQLTGKLEEATIKHK